jgi:superfamily I DNA/RNA helicase
MQIGKIHAPAGTGKTREIIGIMTKALNHAAVGGDVTRLGFSTLTRKGRQEAAERAAAAWGVSDTYLKKEGYFGTTHAVAYRALGVSCAEIIGGGGKDDQDWFRRLLGVDLRAEVDDDGMVTFEGDPEFQGALWAWHLARTTMRPVRDVLNDLYYEGARVPTPGETNAVIKRYEEAKKRDHRIDFDDLLGRFAGVNFTLEGVEECRPDGDVPDSVVGWCFDEAQDSSKLLVRSQKRLLTGDSVEWCWLAADVFQSVHQWNGADPSLFLNWPADKVKTLSQSFRCPAPIVDLGEACLRRLRDEYIDRHVVPADHKGEICRPYDIEDAMDDLSPSTNTLVLSRTNRCATRVKAQLRERDIPHIDIRSADEPNSATIARAAVIRLARGEAVSATDVAAMHQLFRYNAGGVQLLANGCKKTWKKSLGKPMSLRLNDLGVAGATEHLVQAIASGTWTRFDEKGAKFVRMAEKWGLDAVVRPQVKVGTIHASKGTEADHVVLCTGSTRQITQQVYDSTARYHEECRVEYTAVTRTKRKLTLAPDLSTRHQMDVLEL